MMVFTQIKKTVPNILSAIMVCNFYFFLKFFISCLISIYYSDEMTEQTCRRLSTIQLVFDADKLICDFPTRARTISGCV